MASSQDIKITEALLILCLAYYAMKQVQIEALWLSCIEIWGVTDREYKAYWLIGVPIINS